MNQIVDWLERLNLEQYEQLFLDHCIDLNVLPDLTDQDLEKIGIPLGHRRKMVRAIAELKHSGFVAQADDEPERRQLTVMFCDLVDSTALSSRLDPEDMREVLLLYQSACANVIRAYDGYLARFLGDGILAYFGYPSAHEDDAERAVRAGLDIIAAVGCIKFDLDVKVRMRIGVATGLVVVGDLIGEGAAEQRAVVGETPNVAARLQALAEPNTVIVGESTRRLLGQLFELKHLGLRELKGIPEKVSAWTVEGLKMFDNRFEAIHALRLTDLVGREREIRLLLEQKDIAWQGQGRTVLVSGDPGVGKSRIAAEVNRRVATEAHVTMRYQCSPYHSNSALYPFITHLERAADIRQDDTPEQRLEKLETTLVNVGDISTARPLLASMLSIPTMDRYQPHGLSPAQQRHQTFAALLEQLVGVADDQAVLFIFEDAHWADATSIELLGLIIERIRRLPVFAIITYRSEFKPPWPATSTMALSRLPPHDIQAMIGQIANGRKLPDEVLEQIIRKTDGIPLFVEEFTKALLQADILVENADGFELSGTLATVSIPATLQDSLMARLDRLASVKEIAQIGAVIGREFSYVLLNSVVRHDEAKLKAGLAQLEDAELVFRRGESTEAIYSFKHALVRDAAYESLLRSRRQVLHRQIAEALRDQFAKLAAAEPEVLAHHFTQAGQTETAIEWWDRAGQRSMDRSAYSEAIANLRMALGLAEELSDSPARRLLRLGLQTNYGRALLYGRGHGCPETTIAFIRARELAARVEDATERFLAYYGIWVGSLVRAELASMQEIAQAFLADAQRYPESPEAGFAHRAFGTTCWFRGDYVEARVHLERALAAFECHRAYPLTSVYGYEPKIMVMLNLAPVLLPLGDVERATDLIQEAVHRAHEGGHIPTIAISHYYACLLAALCRNPGGALPHAEALVGLASKHALQHGIARGKFLLGWARLCTGDLRGKSVLYEGMDLLREMNLRSFAPFNGTLLAELEAKMGRVDDGLATLDIELANVETTGERWFHAEMYRVRGVLLQQSKVSNVAASEAAFLRAIDIAKDQQTRTFELRASISLAKLYKSTGRKQAARVLIESAIVDPYNQLELPELSEASGFLQLLDSQPERAEIPAHEVRQGFLQDSQEL
jgi:class 3 adenylate cyclase/tetratricopeptide (TPR) repeat protein